MRPTLAEPAMPDAEPEAFPVWQDCPTCHGEGHLYSGHPNDPHPRYEGVCPTCEGAGQIEVETEPVDFDDLDALVPTLAEIITGIAVFAWIGFFTAARWGGAW